MSILRDMMDRVRFEAHIRGADTLTGAIIQTLNGVLREYTGRRRFDVLFMPDTALAPIGAGNGTFNLPADLQSLQKNGFQFTREGDFADAYPIRYSTDFYGTNDGWPNRLRRVGNTIVAYPYSDITTDSRVYINYWRFPITLSTLSQSFEIPELEECVILQTASRIARIDNSSLASDLSNRAKEAYMASFGPDPQR